MAVFGISPISRCGIGNNAQIALHNIRAPEQFASASLEHRLRGKRAKWVRVPTGVALIGGGVLGFFPLPVVAFH